MNKLYITGDITYEAYEKFSRELEELEKCVNIDSTVTIELSSEGGDAYVALAFYDRIYGSALRIDIIGTGLVASAAALILAAGHSRALTSSAWVMVHDDEVNDVDGRRVVNAIKSVKHSIRLEKQWNKLMEQATGTPASTWDGLHQAETYLTPEQCYKLGLIDRII